MPTGSGMRAKDLRVFCMIAQRRNAYILVRHNNEASLQYIGRPGYYPKPLAIKAKTADRDPPPFVYTQGEKRCTAQHQVAGLVTNPWFQPSAYLEEKVNTARDCWLETLEIALSPGCNIPAADAQRPDTWTFWGKEHSSARTGLRWKIDIDPGSAHFGCLHIVGESISGWCYVHGDYDLKDVVVKGSESLNERSESKQQGVKNYTPLLPGMEFETIRRELNQAMGAPMVQHGSEAQFAWHRDEPITVILPEGPQLQFLVLGNAEAVQSWYINMNRRLIAEKGKDYLGDRTRWFWFGNHGNLFVQEPG